jgi:hypothetical protein
LLALTSDERGYLWMYVRSRSGRFLHVFDERGSWLARIRFPVEPIFMPELLIQARGSFVVVAAQDSLGVPTIHRFQVDLPTPRGLGGT